MTESVHAAGILRSQARLCVSLGALVQRQWDLLRGCSPHYDWSGNAAAPLECSASLKAGVHVPAFQPPACLGPRQGASLERWLRKGAMAGGSELVQQYLRRNRTRPGCNVVGQSLHLGDRLSHWLGSRLFQSARLPPPWDRSSSSACWLLINYRLMSWRADAFAKPASW